MLLHSKLIVQRFPKIFLGGVTLAIVLVLIGWVTTPKANIAGLLAGIVILSIYGIIFWLSLRKLAQSNSTFLSVGILFGLIAGSVFAGEIILEYILLPSDNTFMGLIEFGSVFFLYFLASIITAYQTGSIQKGVLSAITTALIATLIWSIVTLSVFYLFRGSARQKLVFQAEGNYADFQQSGIKDFNTFIMEDFFGAIFFHSLLGPILAAILGTLGGTFGRSIAALKRKFYSSQ